MDLNQAIAKLLSQKDDTQLQDSTLSETIGQIVQLVSGNQSTQAGSNQDAEAVFAQLAEAARSGQQGIFQELIEAEQQNPPTEGTTLLIAAVMADRLEVVNALISAGADVNAKIKQFFEFNALSFAIKNENLAIAKALLEAGADPNWSNASPAIAPLTEAINQNNVELVRLLLDYQASIKFETRFDPLVKAAQQDNPELIQLLLEAGCSPNTSDSSGSPLSQACSRCHVETIKTLLAAGANPGTELLRIFGAPFLAEQMSGLLGEQPDPTPKIPLAIQAFIDAGADLDVQGQDGTTALTLAISAGYLDVVNTLLGAGANPNLPGQLAYMMALQEPEMQPLMERYAQATPPLSLAAAFGNTEIVQLLIEGGADMDLTDEQGRSAIAIAIQEGHQEIVQLLEKAGARVSSDATTGSAEALLGAAKQSNVEILRSALAAGIDPNISEAPTGRQRRHKTALMYAAEGGHLEAVKMLVESGATVNLSDRPGKKLGKTPLMYAAEQDRANVVRFLLEAGATVDAQDKRGQTALFYAVQEESAAAVEVLLEFGADPHKKSWDGTPFEQTTYSSKKITQLVTAADRQKSSSTHKAARQEMLRSAAFDGNADLVRDLIHQGVNVNAADRDKGWTALIYGAAKGSLTVVQLLLAAGADVNLAATSGQTAVSEAAYWGHAEVLNLLISAGAALNVPDRENGWTPVMKTVVWENTEILRLLLDAGADATLRDHEGRTVLAIALADGKGAIVEVLQQAGIAE